MNREGSKQQLQISGNPVTLGSCTLCNQVMYGTFHTGLQGDEFVSVVPLLSEKLSSSVVVQDVVSEGADVGIWDTRCCMFLTTVAGTVCVCVCVCVC